MVSPQMLPGPRPIGAPVHMWSGNVSAVASAANDVGFYQRLGQYQSVIGIEACIGVMLNQLIISFCGESAKYLIF